MASRSAGASSSTMSAMSAGCSLDSRSSEIFSFTRRAGSVSIRSTNSQGIMRGGILCSSGRSAAPGTTPLSRRRTAPRAPTSTAPSFSDHVSVLQLFVDVHVVHAHYLAAMHVDNLLVEQVAFQQQHALAAGERAPVGGVAGDAQPAVDEADGRGRHQPVAMPCLHDEAGNLALAFVRGQRHFAHFAHMFAGIVGNRRADQVGECKRRHCSQYMRSRRQLVRENRGFHGASVISGSGSTRRNKVYRRS